MAENRTYTVITTSVRIRSLPPTTTLKDLKELTDLYGGTCQIVMTDRGMYNPDCLENYFYYESKKESDWAIQRLYGARMRGAKAPKLTDAGQRIIMAAAVEKDLRGK